eukprot:TRINITY_DN279_c0_g1_i1.p1 TRINITY_DN279_c0_g1~~TRINITY_DN279_c0_g1_i1.p1  ORF type:complete len:507 (+),score=143.45 TRINITY_DN279_c0_g1_i1:589-2109(+)
MAGWEVVQEKAFTSWVNGVLEKCGRDPSDMVKDISEDFDSGVRLIHFLEDVSGKVLKQRYDEFPKSRIQQIQNVHLALNFVETLGFARKALSVGAEDFVDHNKKLILGFLWTLYRRYRIAVISEGDKSSEEGLLAWCKRTTEDYEGVNIAHFKTSFRDGAAFMAITHSFNPDTFSYSEKLKELDAKGRLALAFEVAERDMKVPKLLDIDEIIKGHVDERSLVLYTSLCYHAFKAREEREELLRQQAELAGKYAGLEGNLKNEKLSREELIRQKEELERYKASLAEDISKQDKTLGDLNSQNALLTEENTKLKSELEELRTKYQELVEKYDTTTSSLDSKVSDQEKQLEERAEEINHLNKNLGEAKDKLRMTEAELIQTQDTKVAISKDLETTRRRAEAESQALLVLRQQLDQHVLDIHKWVKLEDPEATVTDFGTEIKPSLLEDLIKEYAKLGDKAFDTNLQYLRGKLETETSEIHKLLAQKEEDAKKRAAKAAAAAAANATTTSS